MSQDADNLIWIDCEMTGLNPERDRLLEVACIITNKNLTILAEGPVVAIHQPDEVLATMDEWCTKQHGQSGLLDRVRASTTTEAQGEQQMLDFIKPYVPGGSSPLCGNSVCLDKRFLAVFMPELCHYFHYRLIDVSTVKELARRWQPALYDGHRKESQHLALQDIRDSITELQYYRQHFFIS